jgi:tRNA U54 and U55 pseudouridine synthase Pus10
VNLENIFTAIGQLAAALIVVAGAIYGVRRMLSKDNREDMDLSLLGRGKATIFEQYEGIIRRLETESARLRAESDRLSEMVTNLHTRSVQQESELIRSRQRIAEFTEMLMTVKREQRQLLEAGGLERPLIDVDTDVLRG